jgi:hypothetical protein
MNNNSSKKIGIFLIEKLFLHSPHQPRQKIPSDESISQLRKFTIQIHHREQDLITTQEGDKTGIDEGQSKTHHDEIKEDPILLNIQRNKEEENSKREGIQSYVSIMGVQKNPIVLEESKSEKVQKKFHQKKSSSNP